MTIQYSTAIRNAKLDAIETTGSTSCSIGIFTGAQPANCAAANAGTLLVEFNLPSDWMAAASGGSKAKANTWSGTAVGGSASTPGHFRIYNQLISGTTDGTTCIIQGSCGIGSGDMAADGTITSGQTVTINSFTLNDNNG
jgi:hypothetical protein